MVAAAPIAKALRHRPAGIPRLAPDQGADDLRARRGRRTDEPELAAVPGCNDKARAAIAQYEEF
jgi:hypothetical protein